MADAPSPPVVDFNSQAASLKKRKRSPSTSHILTAEEKRARIDSLTKELQGLFDYYKEFMAQGLQLLASDECGSAHAAIPRFLEESDLPFSNLVDHIYANIKDDTVLHGQVLTLASVKSAVLLVGQRIAYGLQSADADILEDNASSSLWCWETREMKMLPKTLHGVIKVRRTCRKKIHERVSAISEMLTALQKPDDDPDYQNSFVNASEKLHKVLHEADIRLLMDRLMQKNLNKGAEKEAKRDEKEAKRDEKVLVKQLERQKREEEKEKKRMERDLQKEKVKNEKELKRLQEEAEKEQRRREREEIEMNKQLRRLQDEAEKDQRRREKEEAERKKQLAMQKQASIMERFLKKAKASSSMQNEGPSSSVPLESDSKCAGMAEAVTSSIDSALHSNQEKSADDIRKSHLTSWHNLGLSMRGNIKHWGIRQKPKSELLKELKLTTNTARVPTSEDEMNFEKLVDGLEGRTVDVDLCSSSPDRMHPSVKMFKRKKQLLQFDKSHRPAFYGIWPTKSCVVGPRRPLRKDPELDYEVDSDEEWEEEEPGESLSDCEKDEESLEECSKVDEEDESEDGFFVPDGYLSENEGVQVDRMETDPTESARIPSLDEDVECEELSAFFRQQKYLNTATEHALRKNQPLIIINLMHEKEGVVQSNAENLSGNAKLEYMCLKALSMRGFPGSIMEISVEDEDEDACLSSCDKNSAAAALTPGKNVRAVPDLDLPTIVSTIRSCSPQGGGINKVVESLQHKFPAAPKSQLRNKVREVSDFVDNRWQVKKEVLDKLGLSGSPESSGGRRSKSIAAFFSKRCMPPPVKRINPDEMS